MTRTTRFVLALALGLAPSAGYAQPRWDATAVAGFFAARDAPEAGVGYHDGWLNAALGGLVVGRHLSPHLKLELEATATTSGTQYVSRQVSLPGLPAPYWVSSETTTSVRSGGAVIGWQFRDNEWVHPFVQGGVSYDVEHVVARTPEQFFAGDTRTGTPPQRVAERRLDDHSTGRWRGVVAGGAKWYFRERGYFRADVRLTLDRDQANVAFRSGVGIDF